MAEEISKEDVKKYTIYINDNIQELKLNHRKEILQILMCSNIDQKLILEKGSGTQIKFADIDPSLLKLIYNNIYNKLEKISDVELL
jgi:hypothetical protein